MDFLFTRKYRYTVNRPIDSLLGDFSKVTNKEWSNFSETSLVSLTMTIPLSLHISGHLDI